MIEVVLEYKRDIDKSTGRILIVEGDGRQSGWYEFESIDFEPMLYKFAEALQKFPEAEGVIQRTDREGLVPYRLEPGVLELFRIDPVAAVKSMSTPFGSPSMTARRTQEERIATKPGLRVGHSTLADAFGDELYARLDRERRKIECPCCGIWAAIGISDHDGSYSSLCKNPKCQAVNRPLNVHHHTDKWAAFGTFDLLATHSTRFYFPRAWNEGRLWVSWDELYAKYTQFQKEKKTCQ